MSTLYFERLSPEPQTAIITQSQLSQKLIITSPGSCNMEIPLQNINSRKKSVDRIQERFVIKEVIPIGTRNLTQYAFRMHSQKEVNDW